ncbi:MAG: DUF2807 domain-containing protein [Proteobacteria bacterium]|nr:DUF2807 domain-containing protein [Pseudomonadota bacterium]
MKITNTIITIITLVAISSCTHHRNSGCLNSVLGDGNHVTQNRIVSGFNSIELDSEVGEIYISQGEQEGLSIEGDENILQAITSNVNDGTLKIESVSCLRPSNKLIYHLTVKDLKKLEISGGVNLFGKTPLKIDNLELEISGSVDGELELSGGMLVVDSSGSTDLGLKGQLEKIIIEISGSGDIDGIRLDSETATIDVRGSSSIKLAVSETLSVSVSGSSDVKIKGAPKMKHVSISGSGSIERIE